MDVFHGLLEEDRCTDRPSPTSSSVVGNAFLNEGILKSLYSAAQGTGRFAKIGISYSDFLVPSVDTVETVCGLLLTFGLLTRPVVLALFIDISVAILTTKIPMLLGHGVLGFSVMKLPDYGFLSIVHVARTDLAV